MLTVLALVYTINGLLTWIGKGFGIHELTLQLLLGYIFYPVTFFMGMTCRTGLLVGFPLIRRLFHRGSTGRDPPSVPAPSHKILC